MRLGRSSISLSPLAVPAGPETLGESRRGPDSGGHCQWQMILCQWIMGSMLCRLVQLIIYFLITPLLQAKFCVCNDAKLKTYLGHVWGHWGGGHFKEL